MGGRGGSFNVLKKKKKKKEIKKKKKKKKKGGGGGGGSFDGLTKRQEKVFRGDFRHPRKNHIFYYKGFYAIQYCTKADY